MTDLIEIHIIELPKIKKCKETYLQDELAQWMLFLNNPNDKEVENIMKQNEPIKEAMVKLREISEDDELRRVAQLRQKAIMDEKAIKQRAIEVGLEEGIQKGIQKGIQEGMQKGLQKGLEKGIEKGMEKGIEKEKIEIAKKLLAKHIDIATIAEVTSLSIKNIQKLSSSN